MTDYNTCTHLGKYFNSSNPCDRVSTLKEQALRLIKELTDEECEEILRELHVKGIVK